MPSGPVISRSSESTETEQVKSIREKKQIATKVQETGRDGNFIAYDNGTVLDTRTNLMWAARDNGSKINWQSAKSYCEHYRGGGYKDWRMPTQDELLVLYVPQSYHDSTRSDVYINASGKLIDITNYILWASETHGSNAAGFSFYNGSKLWYPQSSNHDARALPVRSDK